MLARVLAASLCVTSVAALAACQSSARYGTPAYAGAVAGAAVAGAAANRALGGCWAECLPGSHCNTATGLCVRGEASTIPVAPLSGTAPGAPEPEKHPPLVVRSTSYPAGHEYELPPAASMADAGCAPGATSSELGDGGGPLVCEMDGGTL